MDPKSVARPAGGSRRCDVCHKTFVRSEHLERHKRIHTNETPFPCPRCERSFRRSDVRALHVKQSHGIDFATIDPVDQDPTEPKRKRVKTACDLCRKRKLRCDGENPCRQCRTGNSDCHFHSETYATHSRAQNLGYGGRTVEEATTRTEIDPSDQADNEPAYPPMTTSGGTATFADANFQQGLVPTSFLFEAGGPGENHGTIENVSSMMSNPPAELNPGFRLQSDVENEMMLEFWQVPLLNGEAWWDDINFDDDTFTALMADPALSPSPTQSYSWLMQDYFDRRSRAPSPSPNNAASMWYSAPACLWDHDPEIVNVFLNLFSRNVCLFFRLFQDLKITTETRPDYVLAAAAVGGLYCTTAGSFEFTKAMYNDSRRLLLASTKSAYWYSRNQPTYEETMTIIKTYILHELYGLCSGDKRSYEFMEVFHQDLAKALQVLADLHGMNLSLCPEMEIEITRLLESLYIFDCYRACILQRPPSFLWRSLEGLPRSASAKESFSSSSSSSICDLVATIINPGLPVNSDAIEEFSLATLSGLCPFLWRAMPLAPADKDWVKALSKSEFVELAADKWLRSHHNVAEPASLILYHLINMAMHTNLLLVQNYAHLCTKGEMILDKDRHPHQAYILPWVRGRHYVIAKWHAERTLECVQRASSVGSRKDDTSSDRNNRMQRGNLCSGGLTKGGIDIAHVPYAIYYATLILWCGTAALNENDALTRSSHLARGRNLLSQQKLRIATLLERVLREGER